MMPMMKPGLISAAGKVFTKPCNDERQPTVNSSKGKSWLKSYDSSLFTDDCQPNPNDPALASTMPHHKHIPPDIKHNRIPAPQMSFDRPNLPAVIQEIEGF